MKSNSFLRLIIFSLCLWTTTTAQALPINGTQAQTWAQEKGERLLKAFSETDLAKRYEELDYMFLNFIDLDYVSKFVLGKYWRQMDKEKQEKYQNLFKRYALSVYKSFPLEFDMSKITFSINNVRVEKDYANVSASIFFPLDNTPEGQQSILVSFRLNNTDGNLRIIDLKLGESSLLLSYRGRFYEMISQNDEDLDWFMEDLEAITESTEKQNLQKQQNQDI